MGVDPVIGRYLEALEVQRGQDGTLLQAPLKLAGGFLATPGAITQVPDAARWVDVTIPSFDGSEVGLRVVTSTAVPSSGAGAYIYFHGGGWSSGDLDVPLSRMARWSLGAGVVVFAVDYRLAPRHRFPLGLRDCFATLTWVAAHAAEYGVSPERIAVGGDSAGGNLSSAVAIMARDAGGPAIAFQLLEEPSLDLRPVVSGQRANDHGYDLELAELNLAASQYMGEGDDVRNPLLSPLLVSDWEGLPPTHVLCAGHDPLREDGIAYATQLARAGVRAGFTCYPDLIHGSHLATGLLASARAWQEEGAALLRAAVGTPLGPVSGAAYV